MGEGHHWCSWLADHVMGSTMGGSSQQTTSSTQPAPVGQLSTSEGEGGVLWSASPMGVIVLPHVWARSHSYGQGPIPMGKVPFLWAGYHSYGEGPIMFPYHSNVAFKATPVLHLFW